MIAIKLNKLPIKNQYWRKKFQFDYQLVLKVHESAKVYLIDT